MRPPIATPEQFMEVHFPFAGIDLSNSFSKQKPRPISQQEYARTTPVGINIRGYEPGTLRKRGGQRSGFIRYITAPVVSGWLNQELATIVWSKTGGGVQLNQSGRVVTLVAVSQGNVFFAQSGATSWTQATNGTPNTPPLNFSGLVYSTALNQKLWFADGTNFVFFDPAVNTVFPWTASSGTLPVDSALNAPRLIATWRGRIVVSGLLLDGSNWFMSAVSDPTNWNYAPSTVLSTQAIAGTNAPQGLVGDNITALIPYTDDVLVMGGDHTIWLFRGDPMAGGQIDLVSDAIGMAWGIPWTKDPYGNIYFVSNKTGIYTMVPGQQPIRISQPIEQLLLGTDMGANAIRLIWNDRYQGLQVFITPTASPQATTHFFYEQRTGAWWQDQYANVSHNPLCCTTFDGNTPGDRVALIGSWDGYVRAISPTVTTDDGQPISSSVVIGPILSKDLDDMLLKDIQAVMGSGSGQVNYQVFVGPTAEIALASNPVQSGVFNSGRNPTSFIRWAGHAVYVKLSATNFWAMESIRMRIAGQGKVRRRSAS